MGNASVREEESHRSGVGGEEEELGVQFHEHGQHGEAARIYHSSHQGSSELMGQTPPHSPRAARSPLTFTPQVPLIPLQRHDEIQIPSHSWMPNCSGYEDISCEQGIPTMIMWSGGGKEVAVEGSWDNWKTRKPLQRSGKDFTIMKVLPSGVYQYRFIVDGELRYAPDMPWTHDDMENAYNILDLQDFVPEDLESIAGFEAPQSPESSYNNLVLGPEDYSKEPPLVPPHLHLTLLNVPSYMVDSPSALSRPQHVALNHLHVQKGKSGQSVLALGMTHRFLAKYVTLVLYKSLQR